VKPSTSAELPECWAFVPQLRMEMGDLLDRARAAERAGFVGLALMDHLAPPMAESRPLLDAMACAAWLLARTDHLRVGHLVLCDGFRHPSLLAKEAATLTEASGGRFELGLGSGSVPEELDRFGVGRLDGSARTRRLGESLEVLAGLWSGEPFDFEGEFFRLSGAQQRPTPRSPIPIVLGGIGPRTMELVARHATWWNLPVHRLDRLEGLRTSTGAARVSVQLMVAFVAEGTDRAEVEEPARRRYASMGEGLLVGDAAEVRRRLSQLATLGVERAYIWFADLAPASTLESFGAEVLRPPGGSIRSARG
jgi:alkanesulfonate monooxygenase SsuD/methylene tetrahydromethanopterin reductase-like flavin-dependent oxidoreductase (luciferase family)